MENQETEDLEIEKEQSEYTPDFEEFETLLRKEYKEVFFRDTGLGMGPQKCELCGGTLTNGTAISVTATGKTLVFDMFALRHSCVEPLDED